MFNDKDSNKKTGEESTDQNQDQEALSDPAVATENPEEVQEPKLTDKEDNATVTEVANKDEEDDEEEEAEEGNALTEENTRKIQEFLETKEYETQGNSPREEAGQDH